MELLRVTIVGKELFKPMKEKFELVGLNWVNQINEGMLGNLKVLTYIFQLNDDEVISKRKALMHEVGKDRMRMTGLYVHGDWMRILIMEPLKT